MENPGTIELRTATSADTPGILGQIGSLQVRLAVNDAEIEAAQAARYQVFTSETGALGGLAKSGPGRDEDAIDGVCDHLIVVDKTRGEKVVGTYRLFEHDRARCHGRFYSDSEFELSRLVAAHRDKRFLELGRSCVLPEYRSRRTIELLWQGIWTYCQAHRIDVMVGCASFPGTIPARHAQSLSFLAHYRGTESPWAVRAHAELYNPMDLMPKEAVDIRSALNTMPPLIKGYLRLGANVGDGCVVDTTFNTVDVMVVLPCASISQKYIDYYSPQAARFAA